MVACNVNKQAHDIPIQYILYSRDGVIIVLWMQCCQEILRFMKKILANVLALWEWIAEKS